MTWIRCNATNAPRPGAAGYRPAASLADQDFAKVAPKTKLGQALHYLQAQWITLVRYLDDGRYPSITMLSKTPSDPSPLAGQNWLFSKSTGGAHASANLYTLIETAKGLASNPIPTCATFQELPLAETWMTLTHYCPRRSRVGVS